PIFQNPTGSVLPVERRMALIEFCQQHGIVIIEDDACSILKFEQQLDITPLKKFARPQQVIYLGTLSKLIGRNIRVGWLIAPPNIVAKLAEMRQHIDAGLSILPQLLAEQYLLYHHQRHYKMLIQQLR